MSQTDSTSFKRRRHRRPDLAATYDCAVCGERATCYNFGAPACEGCKAFFRRHMNSSTALVCRKQNKCEVRCSTRKQCAACRMRLCMEAGMRKDPLTKDPVEKKRARKTSVDQLSAVSSQKSHLLPVQQPDSLRLVDSGLSGSSSPHEIVAFESSPSSVAYSFNSVRSGAPSSGKSLSAIPPKKRILAVTEVTRDNNLSELHTSYVHTPLRPLTVSESRPTTSYAADFRCPMDDPAYTLSDEAYQQIWQNCSDLATVMCAPWRVEELGETLFNDPMISDPRFQGRFMEARLSRAVRSLKRARCFAPFSDAERLNLLKNSLLTAMTPVTGYSSLINEELQEHTMADNLDDGRTVVRGFSLYVASFERVGVDMRSILTGMYSFNAALKRAFVHDWPIVYSAIVILTIFPDSSCASESSQLSSFELDGQSSFQAKSALVREEHLAFLRRFTRTVCDQQSLRVRHEVLLADQCDGLDAGYCFCLARLNEVKTLGLQLQMAAISYTANQPHMSSQILPLIHELMNRLVNC